MQSSLRQYRTQSKLVKSASETETRTKLLTRSQRRPSRRGSRSWSTGRRSSCTTCAFSSGTRGRKLNLGGPWRCGRARGSCRGLNRSSRREWVDCRRLLPTMWERFWVSIWFRATKVNYSKLTWLKLIISSISLVCSLLTLAEGQKAFFHAL